MYQTFDKFYAGASDLRQEFDRKFADPLHVGAERFVWDYWHVPREYTVLRTPAYNYFSPRRYERFHKYLVNWGRQALGCHDVSPPWLSCYIEGCRQEPHQDLPHGPLAFVFSLTPSRRAFQGGETFIVRPRARIEPLFNRLTIFNPALLHGVRAVKGTHDPRRGRLVIHGWFVNPRPFWVGPLTSDDVREAVEDHLSREINSRWKLGQGFLSFRLSISPQGRVRGVRSVANTLVGAHKAHVEALIEKLEQLPFRPRAKASVLTLPLMIG